MCMTRISCLYMIPLFLGGALCPGPAAVRDNGATFEDRTDERGEVRDWPLIGQNNLHCASGDCGLPYIPAGQTNP